MLGRVEFFPQYLPELNRYLLEFPHFKPAGTEDFFYWEKVNFGMKPTIRINHGLVYQSLDAGQRTYVLAIKQLYATHYFQTAIDLSFCVQGSSASDGGVLSDHSEGLTTGGTDRIQGRRGTQRRGPKDSLLPGAGIGEHPKHSRTLRQHATQRALAKNGLRFSPRIQAIPVTIDSRRTCQVCANAGSAWRPGRGTMRLRAKSATSGR